MVDFFMFPYVCLGFLYIYIKKKKLKKQLQFTDYDYLEPSLVLTEKKNATNNAEYDG